VALGVLPRSGPLPIVVDSSGFKVYGEGEWKVRLHGWSKRRTGTKLHLGVDETTGEIVAAVASQAGVCDEEALPDILEQVEGEIGQVSADGAYDKRRCYKAIEERQAKAVIPPWCDAKIWQPGNCAAPPFLRDATLRAIGQKGRRQWKKDSGYHRRSLAETAFFRFKTIFGPMLRSRMFPRQVTELFIKVAALNRMTHLGMPDSYPMAA